MTGAEDSDLFTYRDRNGGRAQKHCSLNKDPKSLVFVLLSTDRGNITKLQEDFVGRAMHPESATCMPLGMGDTGGGGGVNVLCQDSWNA